MSGVNASCRIDCIGVNFVCMHMDNQLIAKITNQR